MSNETPIPAKPRIEAKSNDDYMEVEDSPHKVYIYDLDKELADIESDDETPIFLPDVEKHLSKIPKHLLQSGNELKPTSQNQLVLYSVPSSLTLPEQQDKVKKAIMEARKRVHQRQATLPTDFPGRYNSSESGGYNLRSSSYPQTNGTTGEGFEAMDIEEEL